LDIAWGSSDQARGSLASDGTESAKAGKIEIPAIARTNIEDRNGRRLNSIRTESGTEYEQPMRSPGWTGPVAERRRAQV